ncbi:non-canonical purine NTP pyrophosphatase [uncultured Helicobacter sp.]|uniref:non-canonical purine NTP pyrophosphatase n=2 Tax=uncultured Helicobacter sp. TaxID=175537 RepID=UPI002629944C|nr:non-canonical purine NTP pyrophosphatase [uncultured Helicobacter sp.]
MTIILATGNQHKIREFHAMLEGKNAKIYTYSEILEPLEILENGKSFAQNAALKAKAIYQALYTRYINAPDSLSFLESPLAIIAEDSGLCIPALNGEPGIYSARYARYRHFSHTTQNSDDSENLQCLIEQIKPFAPTSAFFVAHIAFIFIKSLPLPPLTQCEVQHCEGVLYGEVISEIRGDKGFGYDPIFVPDIANPLKKTLAEFEVSAKNAISHRKKALSSCIKMLFPTLN